MKEVLQITLNTIKAIKKSFYNICNKKLYKIGFISEKEFDLSQQNNSQTETAINTSQDLFRNL